MKLSYSRHELENHVEEKLAAIAEKLVSGESELKAAYDYHPTYFAGLFPALGISVSETRGSRAISDVPDRPEELLVVVLVYQPSMPVRGPRSREEDRTSAAKHTTRTIRGEFLAAVFSDPEIGPFVNVTESRGGDRDEVGEAQVEDRGQDILWVDRTELSITPNPRKEGR